MQYWIKDEFCERQLDPPEGPTKWEREQAKREHEAELQEDGYYDEEEE